MTPRLVSATRMALLRLVSQVRRSFSVAFFRSSGAASSSAYVCALVKKFRQRSSTIVLLASSAIRWSISNECAPLTTALAPNASSNNVGHNASSQSHA